MSAARDAIGREHFPTCGCFQDEKLEMDDIMYGLAEAMAMIVHSNARMNGMCPRASPYFVALMA